MAKRTFFVTGTDTDVGKTLVSAGLLAAANRKGLSTLGLKPVSAGCERTEEGLRNSDALILQQTASIDLPYDQVNPIAFEPPIAPHIAAAQQGQQLSAERISAYCRGALMKPADFAIVEGAGGWHVPLNHRETLASVAKQLKTEVILVVGMKLGCISHTLLTVEAILKSNLPLVGWVANSTESDMNSYQENLETLKAMVPAPLLGEVPFLADPLPESAADYLNFDHLGIN